MSVEPVQEHPASRLCVNHLDMLCFGLAFPPRCLSARPSLGMRVQHGALSGKLRETTSVDRGQKVACTAELPLVPSKTARMEIWTDLAPISRRMPQPLQP